MPGFWLLDLLFTSPVGDYATPVFFTATQGDAGHNGDRRGGGPEGRMEQGG